MLAEGMRSTGRRERRSVSRDCECPTRQLKSARYKHVLFVPIEQSDVRQHRRGAPDHTFDRCGEAALPRAFAALEALTCERAVFSPARRNFPGPDASLIEAAGRRVAGSRCLDDQPAGAAVAPPGP
jgi:hypothetical protein